MKQSKWVSNCLKKTRKVFGLFLISLLMAAFFSHSAFAASDISISSSGTVSFGKVQPSSIGTLVTGEDNLSVNTTCTEGANVYASSVNDNGGNSTGTSLINLAAKAKDSEGTSAASYTINTSSAAIGSAATLVNNTWGLNTNTAEAASGLYYGLPAFSDSTTPTAIYTGTATSIPVYFGVRVTSTLVPGTYTGQVLYTATVNTACLNYTVTFNKNAEGASGTMENQTILPAGGNLRENTFEYSGYTFLGWSTSPEGKTGTVVDGIGTEADVEYENEALFPDATTSPDIEPGDDVTLYAIWEKDIAYMQDWATEFGCGELQPNEVVTLVDSRDNHEYKVKKLPDGKCWMIQNLTLSATDLVTEGKALTSADTNIPASDTNSYYIPPRNTRYATANSITNSAVATASASINFGSSYSNHPQVAYKAKGDTNHKTGNALPEDTAWYPFYTATLGFSYYNDGKTSGSSPRDICPKGWRLPWTSDSGSTRQGSAEFYKLALAYNSNSSVWSNYIAPTSTGTSSPSSTDTTIRKNMILGGSGSFDPTLEDNGAAGFTYAGYYNGTTLDNVGTYGRYWSSSVYANGASYDLFFNTSGVYPQDYLNNYNGFAVRCVTGSGYMQDFDSSTIASNQVVSLIDKRDNHVYKVKKLPDGKVWMIQNLTLSATDLVTEGKALTSADTNIPASDTNSYYIPPRNTRYATANSITNSAVATASTTVDFSSGNSNQPQVAYKAKGDTSAGNALPEDTAWYPFYTATLGFSYYYDDKTSGSSPRDICPKGWRLPWVSDSGSTASTSGYFQTLMKAYNPSASWTNRDNNYTYYTTDATIRKNMILGDSGSLDPTLEDNGAAGFTYTGSYYGTTLYNVGAYGHYWSSSVYDDRYGYRLVFDTSDVRPQSNYYKYFGLAVRCVTGS